MSEERVKVMLSDRAMKLTTEYAKRSGISSNWIGMAQHPDGTWEVTTSKRTIDTLRQHQRVGESFSDLTERLMETLSLLRDAQPTDGTRRRG